MSHLDAIAAAFNNTAPIYLYFTLFFFAFLENIFPPSPSDLLIAFGGSLVGLGKLNFVSALFFSTLGSIAGFVTMYYIGFFLGRELIDSGKLKFLPLDKIKKVEGWFREYGYGIVVANRFLSGTRAVISFFVGLSELSIVITLPLCGISALLWNAILIFGGAELGGNWKKLSHYLDVYGMVIGAIVIVLILFFLTKYFRGRNSA